MVTGVIFVIGAEDAPPPLPSAIVTVMQSRPRYAAVVLNTSTSRRTIGHFNTTAIA
jgi:hypothetical protein